MRKMIEIKNITKKYKNNIVFEDVSLDLYDNKIYGFVGQNGCGKSILFKMICGYVKPNAGEIIVEDKCITKGYDFPDSLGALIENPGFLWRESAMSNLLYLANIKKQIGKAEVADAIRNVGLAPESKLSVGKYSLGMKQRLGIAQAIMEMPNILVLDEPMNGLDDEGISIIRNVILEYKAENRIILLASHNKEDIRLLCDEVYQIKNGKINRV